jgi:hypothetical protein
MIKRVVTLMSFGILLAQTSLGACKYKIVTGSEKLSWTGYKFSKKTGVEGSFDQIMFTQNDKATSLDELLKSITFRVDVASLNSGLVYRDKKLVLFTFGNIKDPAQIVGRVSDAKFDEKTAEALITLNQTEVKVPFKITSDEENTLTFTGSIDLLDFKMNESFERLHEACKELHTAEDGVSKTWSQVGLVVTAKYAKQC